MQARMVRSEHHKYMAYSEGEPSEQLFDLLTDPGETKNRAGEAAAGPVFIECRRLLKQWCRQTSDDVARAADAGWEDRTGSLKEPPRKGPHAAGERAIRRPHPLDPIH